MDSSDNANLIMPAAISVLKLPVSDERDHWVNLLMAGQPLSSDAGKWPLPREVSKSPPQPKGWRKQRMVVAGRQESPEQKLDDEEQKLYDVDFPMERVGSDQKVVMGLAGQWGALENARFIPKQGDRRKLMYDILTLSDADARAMYEWLKNVIISSRYITPGKDTLCEIKIKTIAMLRKMLDPDSVCGEDIKETAKWRNFALHCSSLFVNIAGELICQWTEGDDDDTVYFPGIGLDHTEQKLDKGNDGVRNDLNKRSENNVDRPDGKTHGSKPFFFFKPLSKDEVAKLEPDYEDVVFGPTRPRAKCC